eukprot:11402-Hanusia_phi.AAC.1
MADVGMGEHNVSRRQSTQEVGLARTHTQSKELRKSRESHGRKAPDYTPSSQQLSSRSDSSH